MYKDSNIVYKDSIREDKYNRNVYQTANMQFLSFNSPSQIHSLIQENAIFSVNEAALKDTKILITEEFVQDLYNLPDLHTLRGAIIRIL